MSVPSHRSTCQTRMWQTTCRDCTRSVFFFSCTCGSKVFFDAAGPPWPLHAHTCLTYQVRVFLDIDGRSPQEIRRLIEREAADRGMPIPPELDRLLPARRRSRELTVLEILPSGDRGEVTGRIMSCDQVNFFRRFNLQDNALGRAMLGDLLNERYTQIVLRESHDEQTYTANQFNIFVPQSVAPVSELRQDRWVTAVITPRAVLQRQTIWVAGEIRTV